ncbi:MAG: DUF1385 domain-containing protein [archaeon]
MASSMAMKKKRKKKTELMIGGQAVIEGVLMRSKEEYAVAVRRSDKKIIIKKERFISITSKSRLLGLPFIRGMIVLFETLILGIKALNYSADQAQLEIEDKPSSKKKVEQKKPDDKAFSAAQLFVVMLFSFGFTILLFKLLPLLAATLINKLIGGNNVVFNLIDGIFKLVIFIGYLLLISLMSDVRRLFQYHGAEHKTVSCYEKKKPLTVANIRKESRVHPRCGTSFIILVLVLSIIFYLVIPMQMGFWLKLLIRIAFLPIIAGISYELIKFSGKHHDSLFSRILIGPSLLVQKLTTREPDDDQIEVAVKALKGVI